MLIAASRPGVDRGLHEPGSHVRQTTIFWEGKPLDVKDRDGLVDFLNTLPPSFLRLMAPAGVLRIVNLSRAEFARRFPETALRRERFFLKPGLLYLHEAEKWTKLFLLLYLEQLTQKLRYVSPSANPPIVRWGEGFLIPTDFRFAASRLVKQFASQGLQIRASEILDAELGLTESSGELGQSSHQVRVRTTNPLFNRWLNRWFVDPLVPFDPVLQIYAGFFATATTLPEGLVGVVSWGGDTRLTTLSGFKLFWDSNLQHRVRSSADLPSDEIVWENMLRLQFPNKRSSVGGAVLFSPIPEPTFWGSVVASVVWK